MKQDWSWMTTAETGDVYMGIHYTLLLLHTFKFFHNKVLKNYPKAKINDLTIIT